MYFSADYRSWLPKHVARWIVPKQRCVNKCAHTHFLEELRRNGRLLLHLLPFFVLRRRIIVCFRRNSFAHFWWRAALTISRVLYQLCLCFFLELLGMFLHKFQTDLKKFQNALHMPPKLLRRESASEASQRPPEACHRASQRIAVTITQLPHQNGPKDVQNRSKLTAEEPQGAPEPPKMARRISKIDPKMTLKMTSKCDQNCSGEIFQKRTTQLPFGRGPKSSQTLRFPLFFSLPDNPPAHSGQGPTGTHFGTHFWGSGCSRLNVDMCMYI